MGRKSPVKSYIYKGKKLFRVAFDYKGHRVRSQGYLSREAAEAYALEAQRLIVIGQWEEVQRKIKEDRKKQTVSTLYEKWIKSRTHTFRASTKNAYRMVFDRFIVPSIGNKDIREVTARSVETMLYQIREKEDKSLGYIKRIATAWNSFSRWCSRLGYIQKEQTCNIKGKIKARDSYLTPEEVLQMLSWMNSNLPEHQMWVKNVLAFQYYCFLRYGEATALLKEDIDTENWTMSINKTCAWIRTRPGRQEVEFHPTKNNQTNDRFPVCDELKPYLRDQLIRTANSKFMFIHPTKYPGAHLNKHYTDRTDAPNRPPDHTLPNRLYKRAAKAVGVKAQSVSTHTIRKSAIASLLNAGASIKVVEKAARICATTILTHYSRVTNEEFVDVYNELHSGSLKAKTDNQTPNNNLYEVTDKKKENENK